MAQREAPAPPRRENAFAEPRNGAMTRETFMMLHGIWRQIVAGHVIVPCTLVTVSNLITLKPKMHEEGAAAYGDFMTFAGMADASTTAAVTANVATASGKALATVKVYKDGGATQAGNGDILANRLYLFIYNSSLDGGAGGLVLK